jgi:hypothetical protein
MHGTKRIPLGQFTQVADHGARIDLGKNMGGAGRDAIEDVDHGVRCDGTQPPGLGEMRDKECVAAGGRQGGRCRFYSAAIRVGFDDGRTIGRRGATGERAPILYDRGAINRQEGADFCSRQGRSRGDRW